MNNSRKKKGKNRYHSFHTDTEGQTTCKLHYIRNTRTKEYTLVDHGLSRQERTEARPPTRTPEGDRSPSAHSVTAEWQSHTHHTALPGVQATLKTCHAPRHRPSTCTPRGRRSHSGTGGARARSGCPGTGPRLQSRGTSSTLSPSSCHSATTRATRLRDREQLPLLFIPTRIRPKSLKESLFNEHVKIMK